MQDFNPRAPCGARQRKPRITDISGKFQSTRPLRGATTAAGITLVQLLFQSTRPLRGATARLLASDNSTIISIHAPLAGRDSTPSRQSVRHLISIHAPLAGRDHILPTSPQRQPDFNPRAPCGARHKYIQCRSCFANFNPRAPCGARLCIRGEIAAAIDISIHAPLAGRDHLQYYHEKQTKIFQSTRPLRGATRSGSGIFLIRELFQSTRPLRGATKQSRNASLRVEFQSTRPLRGATL